jgi:alkylation response protein AidB-like acyl-CoA dehydrogenase
MNFDDTPQEAEFRATARAWIGANAPKQYEEELRKSSLGRTQLKNANILEVAKAWQKKKADAGWACLHWPKAKRSGASCSPSRPAARTSRACARARRKTATTG